MKVTQTAPTPTIDTAAPATFTCAQCPFARLIEDNRYCCQVSQTASDVKRGHWQATVSCYEALAQAEAEKVTAETVAPITPAPTETAPAPVATPVATPTPATLPTPAAIGTNGDEPPNRGDNGRGRVQSVPAKKLMLSLVAVKRISSDIPASNFDQFELEVAGELSLAIGGFIVPPVLVRDSSGYKVIAGHFQYHAAVVARRLNPRAGETIPAIVLEEENQSAAISQLKRLKLAA